MSFEVEFGSKDAADHAREEYSDWVCPIDDDKRLKTVSWQSDTPDAVEDAIETDAMDSRGEQVRSVTASLTEDERDRISDLGGFEGMPTTFNWESAKGVFAREGLTDQFHDAMGSLTDHDDPSEGAEEWTSRYQEGGEGGGKRDRGEEDVQQQRRAADAARKAKQGGCETARGHCDHGDPEACEFLREVCGYSEDEIDQILGDDRHTDDATEQTDLVTVGGDQFPEMEVTPAEAGALRQSWTSYKAGTGQVADALDTIREEVMAARQGLSTINAIREDHGHDAMHPNKLHDLLDALTEMPGDIPEVRTLDHFADTDGDGQVETVEDADAQPDADATEGFDPDAESGLEESEQRGRIKHHIERGDLGLALSSLGLNHAQTTAIHAAAGDRPLDLLDYHEEHGGFRDLPGVGEVAEEQLEDLLPYVRYYHGDAGETDGDAQVDPIEFDAPEFDARSGTSIDAAPYPAESNANLGPVQDSVATDLVDAGKRGDRSGAVTALSYALDTQLNPREARESIIAANWILGKGNRYDPAALLRDANQPTDSAIEYDAPEFDARDGRQIATRDQTRRDLDRDPRGPSMEDREHWHRDDRKADAAAPEHEREAFQEMVEAAESAGADPDQFAAEMQGTLGGDTTVEEDKQFTLTGEDADNSVGTLPQNWRVEKTLDGQPIEYRATPYSVEVDRGGGGFYVLLHGNGEQEFIAEGLDKQDAMDVLDSFTTNLKPPEISFHSSDSALMEAKADAKKAIDSSGGLSQFSGGSGNERPPVDVVMTVIGGKDATDAIEQSAALLGYEASRVEPPVGKVEFVDYPFTADATTEERIEMVVRAVETHHPKIAVGPDIEGDMTLSRAEQVGDALLDAGAETVVLTPKDVPPGDVPDRFRVGFPAADFGSGAGHFIPLYQDVESVHILGGSPTVQLNLAGYGLPVDSVDGSGIELGAKKYDIWTPEPPHWEHAGDASDLYERIAASLNNVAKAWADYRGVDHPTVSSYETGETMRKKHELAESQRREAGREARRRQAGRGPPLTDPETGEVLDTGTDSLDEAVEDDTLERHDRMMLEALTEAVDDGTTDDAEQAPADLAVAVDVDLDEPNEQQATL